MPMTGKLTEKAQVVRKQLFSADVLGKAKRSRPSATKIKLDPAPEAPEKKLSA